MGNQKLKWTAEEEEALLAGIQKYGPGKWKNILNDSEFAPALVNRTNIDLKDKWRNLTVSSSAQGSKDKSRTAKVKSVTVTPPSNAPNFAPSYGPDDGLLDDLSNGALDVKNQPKFVCNTLIFEALSSVKHPSGCCDISTIFNFIEKRHEVPQNFRRQLNSRLRRLVSAGKLEKVQNSYRVARDALLEAKTPALKPRTIRPKQSHSFRSTSTDTIEESAAYIIADAENKSFLAAEAVKEFEKLSMMAEEADSTLQLAKEIYERCTRCGTALLA